MIWHLYDYYLDAGGGYFGAKKACEPLHIQYSYDDRGVYVVNSRYDAASKFRAMVHVYDLRLKESFSQEADVSAGPDSSNKILLIPDSAFSKDSQVYFVKLDLRNAEGELVSQNFYWVPAALTTFDWAKTDYTHTPALQHEAMQELRKLPAADITAEMISSTEPGVERVRLHNRSKAIALNVALQALDEKGDSIDPVFWSDNYVALMPGESRVLTAKVWDHRDTRVAAIAISGWNVGPSTIRPHIESASAGR